MTARVLLALIVLIAAFNFLGLYGGWYWAFWWYDIPMHLAGGMWIALLFSYLGEERSALRERIGRRNFFLVIVAGTLVVGLLWELFEYSSDVFLFKKYAFAAIPREIFRDSLIDLLNDLLGAAAAIGARSYSANMSARSSPSFKK